MVCFYELQKLLKLVLNVEHPNCLYLFARFGFYLTWPWQRWQQSLRVEIGLLQGLLSWTVVYNQVFCQGMATTVAPSSFCVSKAKPPAFLPIHNVDIRFYLQHPPAHCKCFDPSHDPYHLVCAWNAHYEPNGRELRVHSLHFEVPRESTRPKAKHCRHSTTLLRRVCYSSTRIHSSRARASNARDVPLQVWILYVFPSLFMPEFILINLSQYSPHSGYLVPLSSCRLCANHPPTQLTRYPHGCPRKQKTNASKSSPHCAKLSSNGRDDAYVLSSSSQSSLCQVVLLPGQSSAVDSSNPFSTMFMDSTFITTFAIRLPRFFRIAITELCITNKTSLTFTLRTPYSLTIR